MERQGTSTIVQYVRTGDRVEAFHVHRSFNRGAFAETARWPVPGGISSLRRETVYGLEPAPLGYNRADLIAGGYVKPALYTFDALPFLSLIP